MKKIISICLSISLLCGCGGVKGLQRQSTQNLHKVITEDNEMYWTNEEGHTNSVKMVIQDKHNAQIKIPVVYTESIERHPDKLPQTTISLLKENDLSTIGNCQGCILDKDTLTIPVKYTETSDCVGVIFSSIFFFPITILIALGGEMEKAYREACVSTLQNPGEIKISEGWDKVLLKENGVNATLQVIPQQMKLVCDNKSCKVVDEDNKLVNQIIIHKHISFDKNRLSKLLSKEEAKKKEEARKKAEEDLKWRQKLRLQKKECPNLYRTLYWMQQGGYLDPIVRMKTVRRFEQLDCGWWLQMQMNQAMY